MVGVSQVVFIAVYTTDACVHKYSIEQSFVIIMGCIPPLRTVGKAQYDKLRSFGQSLRSKVSSALTSSRTRSSSRFRSNSEHSSLQDLELRKPQQQGNIEHAVLRADDLAIGRKDSEHNDVHGNTGIQRMDGITESFVSLTRTREHI